jgi:hypothetical protein
MKESTPRMKESTPRMKESTPRMKESTPRMKECAPRTKECTPRMKECTPRMKYEGMRCPLAADHTTVMALQNLLDYQPVNPIYSTAQILQLQASLAQAKQADQLAEGSRVQARAFLIEISRRYHDAVLGARTQVVAQYGPDSTAVTLIGLTRKSERKRPVKRTVAAE